MIINIAECQTLFWLWHVANWTSCPLNAVGIEITNDQHQCGRNSAYDKCDKKGKCHWLCSTPVTYDKNVVKINSLKLKPLSAECFWQLKVNCVHTHETGKV